MIYFLKKMRLPLVLGVSFLDYLAFALIIPHTYSLMLAGKYSLLDASESMRYVLLGCLLATYPLAQVLSNPILGAISDAFSRKRVLLISYVGNFIGYALSAYAITSHNVIYLFLGNGLAGLTGANISTMNAIIADLSQDRMKARRFSYSIMSFGAAFIIGPFVSGQLFHQLKEFGNPVLLIFAISAALSVVNFVLLGLFFHDTVKGQFKPHFIGQDLKALFRTSDRIKSFFVSIFSLYFGWYFFIKFFRVLLLDRLHYSIESYCNLLTYFGICCLVAQGLYTAFCHRFREESILKVSAPLLAVAIFSLAVTKSLVFIIGAVTLFSFSYAIICPALTYVVSEFGSDEHQGKLMAIFQSVQALAQVLAPSLAGLAMAAHHLAPIGIAGICIAIGGIIMSRSLKPAAIKV